MNYLRHTFRAFVLNNQGNLYWLYTASILIIVANWFLAVHGYFEFEQLQVRQQILGLSLLAPAAGLWLLAIRSGKFLRLIAVCVFISMLFQLHFVTLTCFVLLIFGWTKPNNLIAIVLLGFLQVFAVIILLTGNCKPGIYKNLASLRHAAQTVELEQETNGKDLYGSSYSVKEIFDIAAGLRLVKTYYTLYDEYGDYRPTNISLEDTKDLSPSIYFVHDGDSNAPKRVKVDLSRTNKDWVQTNY